MIMKDIIKKLRNYKKINSFITYYKQKIKKLLKTWQKFSVKYAVLIQFLQLSILYFYASITLIYSIINTLGTCPDFILNTVPFIKKILAVPLFKALASPEKTYMLYFLAVQYILKGKRTSIIVKYNFVLLFILEMLQNLCICFWDLFSHRDLDLILEPAQFSIENAMNFFSFYFYVFFLLYIYCFVKSIMSKIVFFPAPFDQITDSAAFWVHLEKDNKKKKAL